MKYNKVRFKWKDYRGRFYNCIGWYDDLHKEKVDQMVEHDYPRKIMMICEYVMDTDSGKLIKNRS